MSDELPSDIDADDSQVRELPPLRIHHFMLWTVVAASMLSFLKIVSRDALIKANWEGTAIAYRLLIDSLAVSGFLLGILWKRRGVRLICHPGHAALLVYSWSAISFIVYTMAEVVWLNTTLYDDNLSYAWLGSWCQSILIFERWVDRTLSIFIPITFAYLFFDIPRWRYFFILHLICSELHHIGKILANRALTQSPIGRELLATERGVIAHSAFHLIVQTIALAALVVAVKIDFEQRVRYHWTHWIGIGIWVCSWLISSSQFLLVDVL